MGVLLRLGEPQAGPPVRGEHLGQVAREGLGRKDHGQAERGVVLRQGQHAQGRRRLPLEAVEVGEGQGAGELPGAVGPEVEEDDRVVVAQPPHRPIVGVGDDARFDELVGHAARIGVLDEGHGVGAAMAEAPGHRLVGEPRAVPPVVAVHGVVAAAHRRDPSDAGVGEAAPERGQVLHAAVRRRVPAVGDGVREHPGDAPPRREPHQGVEVPLVRVHAAVREQADEVQRAVATGAGIEQGVQRGVAGQLVPRDGLVDAGQVLEHDSSRAEVHVPDLGVAHLAGRQPHRLAAGGQPAGRIPVADLAVDRRSRLADGVAARLGAVSPAVENDEHQRGTARWGRRHGHPGTVETAHAITADPPGLVRGRPPVVDYPFGLSSGSVRRVAAPGGRMRGGRSIDRGMLV